jgi:hypothetical protein
MIHIAKRYIDIDIKKITITPRQNQVKKLQIHIAKREKNKRKKNNDNKPSNPLCRGNILTILCTRK